MSPVQQESSALELWELLDRCLGKPELAWRVLQRFEKQLAGDLDRLTTAVSAGDLDTVRETAHRLKGAAANVAAHSLCSQADALESAIRLELSDQYELLVKGLLSEQERFLAAMRSVHLG